MKYEPIPGQAHNPSEEETMSVIRSVLVADDETAQGRKAIRVARKAAARHGASDEDSAFQKGRAFVERTMGVVPGRRSTDLPELNAVDDAPTPPKPSTLRFGAVLGPMMAKLRSFRPTTRQLAIISVALLVVLRPYWFLIGGILIVAVLIGAFLVFGSNRIWGAVNAGLNRVEAHNRARADRMRDGLDQFACRWDTILDMFPDGMVDGLYMPDLQAIKDAEEKHAAALESRLEQMAQEKT